MGVTLLSVWLHIQYSRRWLIEPEQTRADSCAFASSALYRLATYDSHGSNCSSKAEGDLLKLKLFLERQRNNYLYVGHVLRVWFEGMPAAIGWPGGGTRDHVCRILHMLKWHRHVWDNLG